MMKTELFATRPHITLLFKNDNEFRKFILERNLREDKRVDACTETENNLKLYMHFRSDIDFLIFYNQIKDDLEFLFPDHYRYAS